MKRSVLAFFVFLSALNVIYAEQTIKGGSGLFYARQAGVVDSGKFDIGAFYNFTDFRVEKDSYPPRSSDNLVQVNAGYGILGLSEIAVALPVYFNSGFENETSIGDITLIGKVALPREPLGGLLKLGATLSVGFPSADKDKLLGSGKANVLGEANLGLYFHKWSAHLSFGFAEEDYYYEGEPERGLLLKPTLVGSFAFLYNPIKPIDLVAEFNGKSVRGFERGDEDLFALIGLRARLLNLLYVQAGAGIGLPTIIVKTNTDFVFNIGAGIKL
jgi:hypothetical protein